MGRITDPSGAIVAGAKVRAVNTATNVAYTATTSESGDYSLLYLIPGPYTLLVEATGFMQYQHAGINIHVNDKVTLDVALKLGATTESVKVVAEAPLVESATATLGAVVDARRIAELPLKDGNPIMLSSMTPGVMNLSTGGWSRPFDTASPSFIAVNGSRNATNEFTMDGAPNTGGNNGNVAYTPPVGVVEEFKIQTATFDATNGFGQGGVVNVSLKSGTNRLHGSADEFVQNDFFNANAFFSNMAGRKRDVTKQNRWSGTATGPAFLPHLYNGKDKTFWTFAYQGLRDYYPRESVTATVPTLAERTGDFSQLLSLGSRYQIYDPYTTTPSGTGFYTRTPLAGNIVPKSLISPVASKIVNLWDAPNVAGTVDGQNNLMIPAYDIDKFYSLLFRVDHSLSDRHRVFVRGNFNRRYQIGYHRFNDAYGTNVWRRNQGIVLDDVYTISPTFVLNARYSYTRYYELTEAASLGWDLTEYGYSQNFVSYLRKVNPRWEQLPNISVSEYAALSPTADTNKNYDVQDFALGFTKIIRNHTLRFGMETRVYRNYFENSNSASGVETFSCAYTNGPATNTAACAPMGQAGAAFMFGLPNNGWIDVQDSVAEQAIVPAFYMQDDWKISPRLTFNVGVRWELDMPTTERFNRSVRAFDNTTTLSINDTVRAKYAANPIPEVSADTFSVRGGLTFAGVNGQPRGLWNAQYKNFAPRAGLAFRINSKTALRAGAGLFYDMDRQTSDTTGFSERTIATFTADNGVTWLSKADDPYPSGWRLPKGNALGLMTNIGGNVTAFNPELRTPYMSRWQIGIQRELPGQSVFEVAYVGSRGARQRLTRDVNATPASMYTTDLARNQDWINYVGRAIPNPYYGVIANLGANATTGRGQLTRPFTQFGSVNIATNQGYSFYNSLQTRFEKRMAKGYTASVAWTWSKSMAAANYKNAFDVLPEYVISDQDRTHRVVVTSIYELPFGPGRHWLSNSRGVAGIITGGWQVQGIYQGQSGAPLGFGDVIFNGNLADIPLSNGDKTRLRWFNTDAGFEKNAAKARAYAVRYMPLRFSGVRGDGINNWDLSALKNTSLAEGVQLQIRVEFLNAFNHAQFGDPNTTPTSSAFGTVTTTTQLPRFIQLGARLTF